MLSSDSFTTDMLSNPSRLASTMITAMEESDTSNAVTITDPNNGFVMSLFATLAVYSKLSEKIDSVNNYFYPQRARNAEQLYAHLSEFDYVNLMASPATLPFIFEMSKDWVIANAVPFDDNYNRIQIPATSYMTMGGVTYSMYYPIDILVNRNTEAVTAFYNTDVTDKLYTLSTNMLLDVREYHKNGLRYFQIQFNMFQFERSSKIYTVGSEQGFSTTLNYEDQFYALKAFSQNTDGSWSELSYSLTEKYYDYKTPTALLKLLTDTSQIKIEIPQIYFHNGQISRKIKIELYSTRGAVNYSLSSADVTGVLANFDTSSSDFAAPLAQMPTWTIIPSTTEVQGGKDAMSYNEIRDAIVYQRLYSRAPITMEEVIEAGRKAGFKLTRQIDDLTERTYFASNILVDSNDMVIPTFTGSILIKDENLTGNPSSIIDYTDGYYTILPTTTFKVPDGALTCVPMSDGEVAAMNQLTKPDLVTALNSGMYVRQPFHITLLTTPKSPSASIYNLLSPSVQSLSFIAENSNSAPQMSALACAVAHQNDGTGGYRIVASVARSTNIQTADAGNFNLLFTCKTKIGEDVYFPATYSGTDANGDDIWQFVLATNYHITTDDHITFMMYDGSGVLSPVEIPLEQTFNIVSSFNTAFEPSIPVEAALNALLPLNFTGTQVVMSHQEIIIKFGQNLSDQIYCGVHTSWGQDVYDQADETIYFTTTKPIYQTNEDGIMETRVNETTSGLEVIKIHNIGDTPPAVGDFTTTLVGNVTAGSSDALIKVKDPTGILVGMKVWGTNIAIGSIVADIDDDVILLSEPATANLLDGAVITFHNPTPKLRVSVAQTDEGDQVTVADTSDLLVGQSVFGFGIPTSGKVISVDSPTTFTISADTTEPLKVATLLSFINLDAHGVVKVAKGEVLTDMTGAPIIVTPAKNQFRIPALLFDGRLFASDEPDDQAIVTTIAQRLQNFANQITTIDEGLLECADVYYRPSRTMGNAKFGIGNNETITLPLELGFVITIYVDEASYNTPTVKTTMEESTLDILNEEIQNSIISSSEIAKVIKTKLGTAVTSVEVSGINDDCKLRLIALEDIDCACSIRYKLVSQSDGTIDRKPDVTINFVPKPATVDTVATNRV